MPIQVTPIRRRQDVETARMVEHETLKQGCIEAVNALRELVKMVLVLGQTEIKSGVPEGRVKVDKDGLA